jgi:hypothetical protein
MWQYTQITGKLQTSDWGWVVLSREISQTLALITNHSTSVLYFPTLVHGARALNDQASLHELLFTGDILRQIGYTDRQIHRALKPTQRVTQPNEKPDSVAFLPYVRSIFNCISRVLSRHNIKSVGLPLRKIPRFLHSVKNDLRLKMQSL